MEGKALKDITVNADTNFREILDTNTISEDVLWRYKTNYLKIKAVNRRLFRLLLPTL
ncbi:hypothetical protein SAMN02746089_02219 [Caldanaerobius fijiensis DSM 17918]|uniref:Uncharacterized protein n=1 Tax=Caldanaerobius fijiensis DSM 17918 TaxID=1121256 RepID=A0A1M5CXJ0_9THEO|nr:hypothetical protein SAMN02746089_02219 [Caldanaerobius fijiensis DSM 17918]